MNDVVKFNQAGVPATPQDLISGLQNLTVAIRSTTGDGLPYMRLLKSGNYAFGPENIEPEPHSRWAINPYSIEHGWVCWGDGEKLGETMVPFHAPVPNKNELPDYGEEWKQQVSMQMLCMNGEDKGIQVHYGGTAIGLLNAMKTLIGEILDHAQKDPAHLVPLVRLDVDSYMHKKKQYGEIFTPVFDIVDWLDMQTGTPDKAEPEQAEQPEPEPQASQPDARARRGRVREPSKADKRRAHNRAAKEQQDDSPPWDAEAPTAQNRQEAKDDLASRRRRRRRTQ